MYGYLITYRKSTGEAVLERYSSIVEATLERLRRERILCEPDLELVAVASRSESHLQQSHRRYFRRP